MMVESLRGQDENLLFGILAFQLDFLAHGQLIEGMQAWFLNRSKPLAQVLEEKGYLTTARRQMLETLVLEHLRQHDNDAQRSLASIRPAEVLRTGLLSLGDPEVSQAVVRMPPAGEVRLGPEYLATQPPEPARNLNSSQRFLVVRPLEEGGLGIVNVAMDTELSREVALKEIKPRFADLADSRARFLKEAEITGRLEHPGIVPVYGLGTYPDGRPYYAMRMIKGHSLKEAIERFHRESSADASSAKRSLELRELLQRFVDVCNAIEYAHSRGIVHRDLKPGNVMLGKFRETLVVDWGLAKSIGSIEPTCVSQETMIVPELGSESLPTKIGEVVGTAAFMSPEQASGRLDLVGPASDVYSLGATLYNVLTGKVPHAESSMGKMLRNIQEGIFPRPREIKPDVPRALEAICLKAMALRPQDRYASCNALAHDLELYLADEPVMAHREPWIPRCHRWFRKHPRTVGSLTASVLLGLLLVSLIAKWKSDDAATQTRHRQELSEKNTALEAANRTVNDTNMSLADANQRLVRVQELMVDAFQSPDPVRDGREITIFEVLDQAARRFQGDESMEPKLRLHLLESIGDTYAGLSLYRDAIPLLTQCRELSLAEYGPSAEVTMDITNSLSLSFKETGQIAKALPLYQQNFELTQSALGPRHPNTLTAMLNLAEAWRANGQLDRALPAAEKAVPLTREVLGASHALTLAAMNNLALCLMDDHQYSQARAVLESVLENRKREFGERHFYTLVSMNNLAKCYRLERNLEQALPLCQSVIRIAKDDLHLDDKDKRLLVFQENLGECHLEGGDYDLAKEILTRTWERRRDSPHLGPEHPDTLSSIHSLARCQFVLGNLQVAEQLGSDALNKRVPTLGITHPATRDSMRLMRMIRFQSGDLTGAKLLLDNWVKSLGQLRRPDDLSRGEAHVATAEMALQNQQHDTAASEARQASVLLQRVAPESPLVAYAYVLLQVAQTPGGAWDATEPDLVAAYEELDALQSRLPADLRWCVPRACRLILELHRARGTPRQVKDWEEKLQRATTAISREVSQEPR